jgi:hypothetical protein
MAVQKTVNNGHEKSAVSLDVTNGETLVYRMTVRGPRPIFALKDSVTNVVLLSNASPPKSVTPNTVFERKWPLDNDLTADNSSHTMAMGFLGAVQYDYVVEHRDDQDQLIETLIDITYKADAPEDTFFQRLGVSCN